MKKEKKAEETPEVETTTEAEVFENANLPHDVNIQENGEPHGAGSNELTGDGTGEALPEFEMSVKPEPTREELEQFHKDWSAEMKKDGWRRGFGTKVSETSKVHPLLVPLYGMLTAGQKEEIKKLYLESKGAQE